MAEAADPLILVEEARSDYAIVLSPDAPTTVQDAAEELQHYLEKATGAKLPIVAATEAVDQPVISLGENAAAMAAGVTAEALPVEGYQIVTRGEDLYILGPDTEDGEQTARGGTSTGTRNGVYTFLEDIVGVRWLMPGAVGEDVPELDRLVLEPIDHTDSPAFANRRIPYIQRGDERVQQWMARQRLGYAWVLRHGHYWRRTVPPGLFEQHPDWFAMRNGKRVPPAGRYKLETTNPELVRYYGQQAIEAFEASPSRYSYSLSPSDSRGWSESPESQALYETDPQGNLSITPLILKFYNEVAAIVGERFPNREVAGYIYSDYLYPPRAGVPELEPNLTLVVAAHISYGYGLYRQANREQWRHILTEWAQQTHQIAYYDLPVRLKQDMGAPNGPGLELLELIFPTVADLGYDGVYIYGIDAWGHGALTNYLLAKLSWNPHADVQALAQEFLNRAYGPEAGPVVGRLYAKVDAAIKAYHTSNPEARHNLTPEMLRRVYANHYPDLERLYLQALQRVQEDKDRTRLEMLGQCLALLRWNLVRRGMLEPDSSSLLARNDEQILAMLEDESNRLALGEGHDLADDGPIEPVQVRLVDASLPQAEPVQAWELRGPSQILLYPLGDDEIEIRCRDFSARGELVRYAVRSAMGERVANGVLQQGETIRFAGRARQPYFLNIAANSASYQLQIAGAPFAVRAGIKEHKQDRMHLLQELTPLYFYVPEEMASFDVMLNSAAPGEVAAIEVVAPDGSVAGTLHTVEVPSDHMKVEARGQGGAFWKLRFIEPEVSEGGVDDVYVELDADLPQWFTVDSQRALIVQPLTEQASQ